MSNETRSTDRGAGAATEPAPISRPGLIRSIAHRVQGDRPPLPVEGRLGSFDGATRWLNSEPLTPEGLRGRVVLVDFWTYTCVNWLRTLPYVRAWAAKYADAGLTVVGVHTPEFGFEGNVDNVIAQSRALDVDYPVAVDNDYAVWQSFANHFWPAVYIADTKGRVRFHHFGEGEYAMTEMVIQQLLLDAGAEDVDQDLVMVEPRGLEVAADWRSVRSPETYLGYGRGEQRRLFERYWKPVEQAFPRDDDNLYQDAALRGWLCEHAPELDVQTRGELYGAYKRYLLTRDASSENAEAATSSGASAGAGDAGAGDDASRTTVGDANGASANANGTAVGGASGLASMEQLLSSISSYVAWFAENLDKPQVKRHVDWAMGKLEGLVSKRKLFGD